MQKKLIFEAKNGADIVKFQTYKAEKLSIKESPKFRLPNGKMIKKGSLFNSYKKVDRFNKNHYELLKKICVKNKIEFMSTPFYNEAVDMLSKLGVKALKLHLVTSQIFPA